MESFQLILLYIGVIFVSVLVIVEVVVEALKPETKGVKNDYK